MQRLEIRKYFSALSEVEGFDNWVIGKVSVKLSGNICDKDRYKNDNKVKAVEKKKKANYALFIVEDEYLIFEIHLIRIISKNGNKFNSLHANIHKKSKDAFYKYVSDGNRSFFDKITFKKDEIIKFVCDVNDVNPIHRTNNAVVPGFLLLEYLLQKEDILSCDIKYILPVFENEEILIYGNGRDFEAWVWRIDDGGYVKVFEFQEKSCTAF